MKMHTKSALVVACALAISACSSNNKGADHYSGLVQQNVDTQTQKALQSAQEKLAEAEAEKAAEVEAAKKAEAEALAKVEAAKKAEEVKTASLQALEQSIQDNTDTGSTQLKLSGTQALNEAGQLSITTVAKTVDKNLNSLVIDGQTIVLIPETTFKTSPLAEQNEQKVMDIRETDITGKVAGIPYSYLKDNNEQMRYGYVTKDGKTHLFIQGYMTPLSDYADSEFGYYNVYAGRSGGSSLRPMPADTTTGVYSYIGKSFYGKGVDYQEYDVTAEVDFANKKVKADIMELGKTEAKLTLGGIISGNTFAGTVNNIVTKGAFYGTKGIDIGGMYYNTQTQENGVFGATQKYEGEGWRAKAVVDKEKTLSNFDVK